MEESNLVKIVMKCRIEDKTFKGGDEDYSAGKHYEWNHEKQRWVEYTSGTDGSTYDPYNSTIVLENYTPPDIEDYLKGEIKKLGVEVDWKSLGNLCKRNLRSILWEVSQELIDEDVFKLKDGRIVQLIDEMKPLREYFRQERLRIDELKWKKEHGNVRFSRMAAYIEAIKKNGIPQMYIDSGNPQGCVLEDISRIKGMEDEEKREVAAQEDYERWCRKWSEN